MKVMWAQPGLVQATLVILAGVYAIRGSGAFFGQPVGPLSFVAMFAFISLLFFFYRPPSGPGAWATFAAVGALVGVIANAALLIAPDAAHATRLNLTFSAVSVIGWGYLTSVYGLLLFK